MQLFPSDPRDRERFTKAFVALLDSVEDPAWRRRLYQAMVFCSRYAAAGQEAPVCDASLLCAICTGITLQHINGGLPLKLPLSVIYAYLKAGPNPELPLFECEDCGYVLPRAFSNCPLCGGRAGIGLYSQKQSRAAACN